MDSRKGGITVTIYLVEDDATIAGAVAQHLTSWGYT